MKYIDFTCSDKDASLVIDPPQPAKSFIPSWYKKSDAYITDENIPVHFDGKNNQTFKKCIPVLDSMTTGYIAGLSSDIYVLDERKHNGARISWGNFPFEVVSADHSYSQLDNYPLPNGFNQVFKWKSYWHIKTPPGYSCLFIHPMHRSDLPFITMSGIVDTDSYNATINFPFLLNEGFTGKLEKGTPIVQIIPFKRDSWKMNDLGFSDQIRINEIKNSSMIENMYKKMFRKRKSYS